ncbi:hypothetical protein BDW02DRAFT_572738 [Decorospora gaudefroyi]|uniref:Uncharacterized protein n=1 Tax=Decorospora gaudefroyi TaxID=184978 RepID=A0A6A5JZQ7_9PLEO|nr:hypothetical protein BDW02DRAFT_572738 [Decorospora gaudefroyi]
MLCRHHASEKSFCFASPPNQLQHLLSHRGRRANKQPKQLLQYTFCFLSSLTLHVAQIFNPKRRVKETSWRDPMNASFTPSSTSSSSPPTYLSTPIKPEYPPKKSPIPHKTYPSPTPVLQKKKKESYMDSPSCYYLTHYWAMLWGGRRSKKMWRI